MFYWLKQGKKVGFLDEMLDYSPQLTFLTTYGEICGLVFRHKWVDWVTYGGLSLKKI